MAELETCDTAELEVCATARSLFAARQQLSYDSVFYDSVLVSESEFIFTNLGFWV